FVVLDVHRPWRKVKVTERRAAEDYAQCMRDLVDLHYPDVGYIRVVRAISQPTPPPPSTRHSRPPKPDAFCDAWNSTTPPSTPAGSTWSKSSLRSCAASASTGASPPRSSSNPRLLPGSISAMLQARASSGCSQPTRLAPKWAGLTRSPFSVARPNL